MKRKSLLLIPAVLAFSLSSCSIDFSILDFFSRQTNEVTLTTNDATIVIGGSIQLHGSYNGTDLNLTWSTSDSSIATVSSSGLVNVIDNAANIGETVTITATDSSGKTGKCVIHVVNKNDTMYDYTIMLYMCGSTLEWDQTYHDENIADPRYSDEIYQFLGRADLLEILSLDIPNNIKIIVETGGSEKWGTSSQFTRPISSSKLQRWEVKNKKLTYVCDSPNPNNMGSQNELASFLDWGLKNYNAAKTGVILWNHGAGIGGVCMDENSGDYLTTAEVYKASRQALDQNDKDKFTWIGYDACLMNFADIASVNADNFEYMVASQETEAGSGWAYDKWLPTLINNVNIDTKTLLDKIASTYVATTHNTYCRYNDNCNATLSVLDLSKMSNFIEQFNIATSSLCGSFNSRNGYNSIVSATKQSLQFGLIEDEEILQNGATHEFSSYNYGAVDLKSLFSKLGIYSEAMQTAVNNLVVANYYCNRMETKPCGLSVFVAYVDIIEDSSKYDISYLEVFADDYKGQFGSKLTSWQSLMLNNGWMYFYK